MPSASWEPDFNPYAAPQADLGRDEPTDFHKIVSTRVSYAEYWRLSEGPLSFFIYALLKTLRVPFLFPTAVPYPRAIDRVPTDQIPAHVLERWRGPLDEGEALGLRLVLCYTIPAIGAAKEILAAVLRSDDGLRVVGLVYTRVEAMTVVREKVILSAGTELDDGRRAITRNDRAYLNMPPSYVVQVVRDRSVAEVIDRHRDWVASRGWTAGLSRPDDLEGGLLRREQELVEFLLGRGVLVPMSRRELERFVRKTAGGVDPAAVNLKALRAVEIARRGLWFVAVAVLLCVLFGPKQVPPVAAALTWTMITCLLGFFGLGAVRFFLIRSAHRVG